MAGVQTESKKKGFNLKGLFLNEDVVESKAPQTAPASTSYVPQSAFTPQAQVVVDQEVRSVLLESLQEASLSGYDYLKFVASLEKMRSLSNEGERFRMAFIAAEQLGVDKSKLIETARHYLQVLQRDAQEFTTSHNAKQVSTVGSNENRIKEIELAITDRNNQIAKLNSEVSQMQQERSNLTGQVLENRTKLDVQKRNFETAHASLAAEIEGNIQKINQYIT